MCRSRRELSNEYLLAKIGVDTAENELLEVWGKLFNIIQSCPYSCARAQSAKQRMDKASLQDLAQGLSCASLTASLLDLVDSEEKLKWVAFPFSIRILPAVMNLFPSDHTSFSQAVALFGADLDSSDITEKNLSVKHYTLL